MNNNYQEKNTQDKKILLNFEYIVRPVIRKIDLIHIIRNKYIINHNHKQPQNTNPHHDNQNTPPNLERTQAKRMALPRTDSSKPLSVARHRPAIHPRMPQQYPQRLRSKKTLQS